LACLGPKGVPRAGPCSCPPTHRVWPPRRAKQAERTFGRPDKTAAYQRAMALHQRPMVARNTALLSPNCFGVYPSPPTPQCAEAAFIERRKPPSAPIAWGFCFDKLPASTGPAPVATAHFGRIHATSGVATAVEAKNCPISLAGRARLNR
jgi:hypothetical protein